ncbi:MAG: efflux RND transporter periplasmic adaptor subunit [Enterobacterales bacterium]|nr:efflux RND transporter periplasmic adaptor subunit [Enterobacterales bacterium]
MSSTVKLIIAVLAGAVLGAALLYLFKDSSTGELNPSSGSEEKKPLYWVAPMDSNYRRDQPGKSPMGMDLVPVFAEDGTAESHGPGAITIAPHIINNLGVRTASAESKRIHNEITTVGYVNYDENTLIHIHPRVDGWIERLFVKSSGDPVVKGEPLYTLYSPQLVNAQEELLIALRSSNKSLISAAKERLRALQISNEYIEKLEKTRNVQQSITFYSPQTGVVDGLKVREGFYVKPGNTLMSIGDLTSVWVEAEVFERDVDIVELGLPVSMTLDYFPGKKWAGAVDYVYPTLNSKTRTLRVRLKFDNNDLVLKPNMFAQVAIHSNQPGETLLIPKEAVIRTGSQERVVLALGDGQFKSVEVQIGRVNEGYIEIIEGLVEGDEIVTSAQFLIDSESSKSSDFKRMSHEVMPLSTWAQGEINEVNIEDRLINITHGPLEAWDMPGMTMNFEVSDDVDIEQLKAGQNLHFEVIRAESGMFSIIVIHITSEPEIENIKQDNSGSAWGQGEINQVDTKQRLLKITHGPIEDWSMPGMTMNFSLAEDIDISTLQQGQLIHFQVNKTEGGFYISIIHVITPDEQNENDSNGH